MARLTIKASPTFSAVVPLPVAGGASEDVKLVFKHRTKTQLDDFVKTRDGKTDAESFMDMVEGWDFLEPFEAAAVEDLLENHIGFGVAAYQVYVDELVKHKAKN